MTPDTGIPPKNAIHPPPPKAIAWVGDHGNVLRLTHPTTPTAQCLGASATANAHTWGCSSLSPTVLTQCPLAPKNGTPIPLAQWRHQTENPRRTLALYGPHLLGDRTRGRKRQHQAQAILLDAYFHPLHLLRLPQLLQLLSQALAFLAHQYLKPVLGTQLLMVLPLPQFMG